MLRYACIIPERPPIRNEARVRPDAMKDEYDFL